MPLFPESESESMFQQAMSSHLSHQHATAIPIIIEGHKTAFNSCYYQFTNGKPLKLTLQYYGNGSSRIHCDLHRDLCQNRRYLYLFLITKSHIPHFAGCLAALAYICSCLYTCITASKSPLRAYSHINSVGQCGGPKRENDLYYAIFITTLHHHT
jgi:hypothetical protein